MKVQFLSLVDAYKEVAEEINAAIEKSLISGYYIGGACVEGFESNFASYCEARYCVGVGNGLDALYLALRAVGVGVGDEVIVPSNTFIATWLAVSQCGAIPVPVEPKYSSFNMDSSKIEEKITEKTKAIVPVHLYGQPCDLDEIIALGKKYNIYVVEDAAQAHGAKYKNKKIGAHGNVVAWSFYPGKNLGAFGDGGAVTTNNENIADKIRELRNYGSTVKYVNEVKGINSRLDPLQAAALNVKLKYLDEWNNRRRSIAKIYSENISTSPNIILPELEEWAESSWHLYVVKVKNREVVKNKLQEFGVDTLIHYPIPPHLQGAYKEINKKMGDYPLAEKLSNEILSLPIGPHLSEKMASYVVECLRKII